MHVVENHARTRELVTWNVQKSSAKEMERETDFLSGLRPLMCTCVCIYACVYLSIYIQIEVSYMLRQIHI